MPVLVTGAAGFLGHHLCARLLDEGADVVGVDSLDAAHDPALTRARLARLAPRPGFRFVTLDLADAEATHALLEATRPAAVAHLAARPGVRDSVRHPQATVRSNLLAFANVLEGCRRAAVGHLLFASSSSVYGEGGGAAPSVHGPASHPLSLYAATKRANELMAHSYAHLFGLPATGLRLFTVYGPWGRPDMAYYLFARAIVEGRPVELFNEGRMRRDFTYVDDAVAAAAALLGRPPAPDPAWSPARPDPAGSAAPFRLYDVGGGSQVELTRLVELLEQGLGRRAERRLLPMQAGDVTATLADPADLARALGPRAPTPIEEGIARFVEWFRAYHLA